MERKIKGLKKIVSETKALRGYYSGLYIQLNYNLETGEAWTDYHCSFGQNSWSQYHDSNIITICNISSPMTMKEIRQRIEEKVEYIGRLKMCG
ncbi:MAG: hypothetical protein LUH21_04235 [Clostridiales bacterium]|nr:hypothetical protein [Clostridiales bacterium]